MPFLTVCVVVLQDETVLLTQRDDFHIWCLPSSGVEDGESVFAAVPVGGALRCQPGETIAV